MQDDDAGKQRQGLSEGVSSDTMYLLISFRKSTPPQNLQLNALNSNSEQDGDDIWGELTF